LLTRSNHFSNLGQGRCLTVFPGLTWGFASVFRPEPVTHRSFTQNWAHKKKIREARLQAMDNKTLAPIRSFAHTTRRTFIQDLRCASRFHCGTNQSTTRGTAQTRRAFALASASRMCCSRFRQIATLTRQTIALGSHLDRRKSTAWVNKRLYVQGYLWPGARELKYLGSPVQTLPTQDCLALRKFRGIVAIGPSLMAAQRNTWGAGNRWAAAKRGGGFFKPGRQRACSGDGR